MTDQIIISNPSYGAWLRSKEGRASGTNCGWCGRNLAGGAPPLADRIAALEAELAERTRERDEWQRTAFDRLKKGIGAEYMLNANSNDLIEAMQELAAERERREAAEAVLRELANDDGVGNLIVAHFARHKD